jgi:hypothetical protein
MYGFFMVIAGFALVLFGLSYQVNPLIAQSAVPAWEQVSVNGLLSNPSNYAGHLVKTNGYVITNTGAYFGGKYSLYEAVHVAIIPTDPNIALSWSGSGDDPLNLASYVQFTYDGQQITQNTLGVVPRMVWIIGTFTDMGQIVDAPRYVIVVSSVSWYETQTITQTTSQTLTARTEHYAVTVPVNGFAELRLATNPSTGCSWWIQSQPSGVEITTSSGTDPGITCPVGVAGCSNLLTIYTIKGLVAGEYVVEFRNGHAWAKNEYYIVVLFHLTVLPQTQTGTTTLTTTTIYTTTFTATTSTTQPPFPFQLPTQPAAVASTSIGIILLIIGLIMFI